MANVHLRLCRCAFDLQDVPKPGEQCQECVLKNVVRFTELWRTFHDDESHAFELLSKQGQRRVEVLQIFRKAGQLVQLRTDVNPKDNLAEGRRHGVQKEGYAVKVED